MQTFIAPDRVFDGIEAHESLAVEIADGIVTAMIHIDEIPEGSVVHRYPGATLTPGLIDSHVHMTPWMVFGLIAAGVTTVRDLGNDVDAVSSLIDGMTGVPKPTIHWSGPLLEGERANWPSISRTHRNAKEVRATVDELAERGVRSIKLYYNATPTLMAAAAEQAHRHGIRVLGHVGATSLSQASAGGVDELQHLAGCLAADLGHESWPESALQLANYEVDHCTTLVVWDALAHLGQPRTLRDAALGAWVHPQVLEAWAGAYHATQPASERIQRVLDLTQRMATIPALVEAKRGILVGSDAPFPGLIPGFSLHDEAGLLVESGLSSLDVLRALTSGNARLMGIPNAGTVALGAPADFALFDGDPTQSIADLSRVIAVWRDGIEIDLKQLAVRARVAFKEEAVSPVDQIAKLKYVPATVAKDS